MTFQFCTLDRLVGHNATRGGEGCGTCRADLIESNAADADARGAHPHLCGRLRTVKRLTYRLLCVYYVDNIAVSHSLGACGAGADYVHRAFRIFTWRANNYFHVIGADIYACIQIFIHETCASLGGER